MEEFSTSVPPGQPHIRQSFVRPQGGLLYLLEQVQTSRCETPRRPWLLGTHPVLKQVVFFQPNCKLWSCPHCAEINKRKWVYRATHGMQELVKQGHVVDFVTVTSHEKLSPDDTVRVLPSAWKKLSARFRYRAKDAQYICMPERHEDNRLHLHLLMSARLGTRYWKDNARECGMGYMAEEKPAYTAAGAGQYMSKYLTKAIAEKRWAKGFRRVRTSQNWPKLPELATPEGWEFVVLDKDTSLADLAAKRRILGYTVVFASSEQGWSIIDTVGQGGR